MDEENMDVFDSQDDELLLSIPEDNLLEGTETNPEEDPLEDSAEDIPTAPPNDKALAWIERMKLVEEEQREKLKKFKTFSPSDRIFPDLRASEFHTVMFGLYNNYQIGDQLEPYPDKFVNMWDVAYVAMPCHEENTRLLKVKIREENDEEQGGTKVKEEVKRIRMWDRITRQLENTALESCEDIYNAIKYYSYAGGPLNVLQYALKEFMDEDERMSFFTKILPWMQTMCLNLPYILTNPIPLLTRSKNYSISFTQAQIVCILANAFFSTFPKRWDNERSYSSINFNQLFSCKDDDPRFFSRANKVRCLLHYFERVADEIPDGVVTFTRKSMQASKSPDWINSSKPLKRMVVLSKGTIEKDGAGTLQVDFANRYIGGGVLSSGAVQEEILFVTYPELMASRLFTENLGATEALLITGCERFSNYYGYASSFSYGGDFVDTTPRDAKGRRCTQIVAIDALQIRNRVTQFSPKNVCRELNKAYVGFSSHIPSAVAISTGKWGCGAFNGDPELKAIIQILAASQAERDLIFFTFGDSHLQASILAMMDVIKSYTIREACQLLSQYYSVYCTFGKPKLTLGEYVTTCVSTQSPSPQSTSSANKLKHVAVSQFYSTPESVKVVSNFPHPKAITSIKIQVENDEEDREYRQKPSNGWINMDTSKGKSGTPSARRNTNTSSSTSSSNDNWLEKLDNLKSNWPSLKKPEAATSSTTPETRKRQETSSHFMNAEEITSALLEQSSEEMDLEFSQGQEETDKGLATTKTPTTPTTSRNNSYTQSGKEYRDCFRPNASPISFKRSRKDTNDEKVSRLSASPKPGTSESGRRGIEKPKEQLKLADLDFFNGKSKIRY